MDLKKMMMHAQKLQEEMKKAQEDLTTQEVTGSAGGAGYLVEVTLDGTGKVTGCNISDALVKVEEKAMLEDLMIAAFNNAKEKLDELVGSKLSKFNISSLLG